MIKGKLRVDWFEVRLHCGSINFKRDFTTHYGPLSPPTRITIFYSLHPVLSRIINSRFLNYLKERVIALLSYST